MEEVTADVDGQTDENAEETACWFPLSSIELAFATVVSSAALLKNGNVSISFHRVIVETQNRPKLDTYNTIEAALEQNRTGQTFEIVVYTVI